MFMRHIMMLIFKKMKLMKIMRAMMPLVWVKTCLWIGVLQPQLCKALPMPPL